MSTERTEHNDRWHDDLAAYSLDALEVREAALLEHHLEGCDDCAERLRWLAPAVNLLPASVPQQEPPSELRARLLEIVESEAPEAVAGPAAADERRRRISLPVFGSFALRPALAGFGICLLLVAGVVGYSLRDGAPVSVDTYAAVSTDEASIASGTLEVMGDEGSLQVADLPATEEGDVYQAWVQHKGNDGGVIPSSVFVLHDDMTAEVPIPRGLDGADQVMVTREPSGGSKKPTEGALLVAEID